MDTLEEIIRDQEAMRKAGIPDAEIRLHADCLIAYHNERVLSQIRMADMCAEALS